MPFPAMSGAEPCTGSNKRGILFRVDVAARCDTDRAGAGRTEIGQDVAKQVGGDHHVEPVRVQHEMRRQDIDVVLVPANGSG